MLQYCGYTGLLMCYAIINHSLPLLSSTQVHDQPPLAGQVQELDQEVTPLIDLLIWHVENPPKVLQSLPDSELSIQSQFLRHVSHPGPWDTSLSGAWCSSKHQDCPRVNDPLPHNTLQQGRLPTPTRSWGRCNNQLEVTAVHDADLVTHICAPWEYSSGSLWEHLPSCLLSHNSCTHERSL